MLLTAPGCARQEAAPATPRGAKLVAAARTQIGVTKGYDPAYTRLAYPGGDVPRKTGVCSDVVIRAARDGLGLDLQQLVHRDMVKAFKAYPTRWGLKAPDANIDHRRVPNLETYWRRMGAELWRADGAVSGATFPKALKVGDILTWRCANASPHVGIVSSVGGWWPRIVHNFGAGTREAPLWTMAIFRAEGHYRWQVSA